MTYHSSFIFLWATASSSSLDYCQSVLIAMLPFQRTSCVTNNINNCFSQSLSLLSDTSSIFANKKCFPNKLHVNVRTC